MRGMRIVKNQYAKLFHDIIIARLKSHGIISVDIVLTEEIFE